MGKWFLLIRGLFLLQIRDSKKVVEVERKEQKFKERSESKPVGSFVVETWKEEQAHGSSMKSNGKYFSCKNREEQDEEGKERICVPCDDVNCVIEIPVICFPSFLGQVLFLPLKRISFSFLPRTSIIQMIPFIFQIHLHFVDRIATFHFLNRQTATRSAV